VRDKTLELALINQMRKAKASLAALIIYKRAKKGILQPAALTRAIPLNSATAKRLIQESKRNIMAQIDAEADAQGDSLTYLSPEGALEISSSQFPPPPPSGLKDRSKSALGPVQEHDAPQSEHFAVEIIRTAHQQDDMQNGELYGAGWQEQIVPAAQADLDANTTVTLHRSTRNGYWVMRPVWVPLADDDMTEPEQEQQLELTWTQPEPPAAAQLPSSGARQRTITSRMA
jgi:hypothetical protein